MSLAAGSHVTENIRLVRLLGKGGMGSVWVAHHAGLDLEVAVKLIAADLLEGGDPVVLARFKREAQLAARLDSPHIVRTLDHGITEAKVPYIVMELLRGESLADRIQREHTMGPSASAKVVREIAAALSLAHAEGVVHRDIKPHNVFLARTSDGGWSAKILDFGIAKAAESGVQSVATSSGVILGTPQYMSPEQLMRAGPVDRGADLWALAVTAYEILLGRLPFRGETLAATLVAITRADLVSPSSIDVTLPLALDEWFARALAADPDRRFSSAEEMATSFEAALEGVTTAQIQRPRRIELVDSARDHGATSDFVAANAIDLPVEKRRGAALAPTMLDASGIDTRVVPRLAEVTENGSVARSEIDSQAVERPPAEIEIPSADIAPAPAAGSAKTVMSAQAGSEKAARRGSVEVKGGSARGLILPIGGVAIVAAVVGLYAAQNNQSPVAPSSVASSTVASAPASSAAPAPESSTPAQVAAPASASANPIKSLGTVPKTTIPAGNVPLSNVWLPEFSIAREEGDQDATFSAAEGACERRSFAVCTDSQWARACEAHPEIASMPSWTATADPEGLLVRGGSSCTDRAVTKADSHDPGRIGLCCSRAVGVSSATRDAAFLSVTSGKLLEYETAFDTANAARAAALMSDPIMYYGREMSRAEAGDVVAWSAKKQRLLHDRCEVSLTHADDGVGWTAECEILMQGGGVFMTHLRYVRGGPEGLLQQVVEGKIPRRITPPDASAAPPKK